jgi:hypothetical protein
MSKKNTCRDRRPFPRASYQPDRLTAACAKLIGAVLRRYPEASKFRVATDAVASSRYCPRLILRFTRNYTAAEQRQIARIAAARQAEDDKYQDEEF